MKISTKGRYALRMLVDLGEHRNEGFIALKDTAKRQEISKKYLEQIVPTLNQSGLLISNRGFQGGYQLAEDPSKITVGQVLRLTEGSLAPVVCLEKGQECSRSAFCETLPVWKGLYRVVNDYLDSITLQDVIDQAEANEVDNYVI
ncbi:RrF2 family transcriptional regulator [Clostridium vitabionis]|jgi:Rrf2 family protein|uniref:RrF2 family transcriptional regulator n=1 Tax=Clostridium vitabionis TaxID=2784388 RepID=UPI00188D6FEC|nr:Rrf2 family transcriptional regulator [Clostridium vitabionis]